VISITSNELNPIALADRMHTKYGYALNKTQNPLSFHMCFTMSSADNSLIFVKDLKLAIKDLKEDPSLNHTGDTAVYGMAAQIPDKSLLNDFIVTVLEEILETH